MVRQIIQEFLIRQFDVPLAKFDEQELKVVELGLDSLGVIEMLFEVEDRYGIRIEDPARFKEMSFNEMVADMEAAIRSHHNGEIPDDLR
jgi:acyl carrier protein